MQSKAATVADYLASLPADRRAEIEKVRAVVRANLDPVFAEGMSYGMIGWFVPHSVFPAGYHCDPKQPLPFGGLAAQKNACSLYLMCLYTGGSTDSPANALVEWFHAAWKKSGRKLDMGKACIRFKKADDLALDVIGALVKRVSAAKYLAHYQAALGKNAAAAAERKAAKAGTAKKTGSAKAKRASGAKAKK